MNKNRIQGGRAVSPRMIAGVTGASPFQILLQKSVPWTLIVLVVVLVLDFAGVFEDDDEDEDEGAESTLAAKSVSLAFH